jgi:hypothetical protein
VRYSALDFRHFAPGSRVPASRSSKEPAIRDRPQACQRLDRAAHSATQTLPFGPGLQGETRRAARKVGLTAICVVNRASWNTHLPPGALNLPSRELDAVDDTASSQAGAPRSSPRCLVFWTSNRAAAHRRGRHPAKDVLVSLRRTLAAKRLCGLWARGRETETGAIAGGIGARGRVDGESPGAHNCSVVEGTLTGLPNRAPLDCGSRALWVLRDAPGFRQERESLDTLTSRFSELERDASGARGRTRSERPSEQPRREPGPSERRRRRPAKS